MKKIWVCQYNNGEADVWETDQGPPSYPYVDAFESEEKIKSLQDDIETLRSLLWLGHGHTGQYGDDGEMQCAECFQKYGFWDWKRTPIQEIAQKIKYGNLRSFAKETK